MSIHDIQSHNPINYQMSGEESLDPEKYKVFLDRLTDLPSSLPLNNIIIDEAGITHQRIFLQIEDIIQKGKLVTVICDIDLFVDLHGHRGIHMSRCEEILFDLSKKSFSCLDDFAVTVAQELRNKQSSNLGIVRVEATYLHSRTTRKTRQESIDRMYLISRAKVDETETSIETGIRAYNMTACPCTRTYTKYSIVPALKEMGLDREQIQKILEISLTGTHTQRGIITLILGKKSDAITSGELYSILDDTTHLVFELLKRPDEHDLVIRALQKPQFTEDVVRDVVYETFHRLSSKVPEDTMIFAESILNDSIHIHDVATRIYKSFNEIGKML